MLCDVAATTDPTKKTTLAMRSKGLRPKMSLSLPHMVTEAAVESRYAEPIHVYALAALNSSVMVGIAVATIIYWLDELE